MPNLFTPEFAGVAAGIISFLSYIWYANTIIKGESTAHFITWGLSALMSAVTLFFYQKAGAEDSIYVLWGDLFGLVIISWLAWKYRHEAFKLFTIEHGVIFASVVIAFGSYIITGKALVALISVIAAEAFTHWPTIKKTWKKPEEEEFWAWTGTMIGNILNIFAIQDLLNVQVNTTELMYVFAMIFLDGVVWLAIFRYRKGLWGGGDK
jgi:hypothetical protein